MNETKRAKENAMKAVEVVFEDRVARRGHERKHFRGKCSHEISSNSSMIKFVEEEGLTTD